MKGDNNKLRERKTSVSSLLCGLKKNIRDKMELSCSASAIHYFIKKKGYKGSYTTVKL
ncbi:TPA: hypothetical protein ACSZA9_13075 [Listeria monocytogenes]|nr:hypothetical protein [Listeria monocytogenes]EKA2555507.1 hypothetical protein [Listeria monocytogenes]EKA2561788.1 hypothetical protein [Listeria monocytogenes]